MAPCVAVDRLRVSVRDEHGRDNILVKDVSFEV